ncbi:MAG: M2 family metallopeptidase, partial [Myxococcales bacterium]|nr:M2 family metallopeptidase [Myxococcales bacterium]
MRRLIVAAGLVGLLGCGSGPQWTPTPCPACPPAGAAPADSSATAEGAPTLEEAEAFMAEVDVELKKRFVERERAGWVQSNFITEDTQEMAAETEQAAMEYLKVTIAAASRFDSLTEQMPPRLRRQFHLLKLAGVLPAPKDSQKTAELAKLVSDMQARYGKGKYCPEKGGPLHKELARDAKNAEALACKPGEGGVDLGVLSKLLAESRNEPALREAWVGWRTISPPMRKDYARYAELGNEGAQAIGFDDLGTLWRSGYDMPPEAFRAEAERLFGQVKPFYEELHCYVRAQLQKKYGKELVQDGAPIPAHLLGNMWSQTWSNVYDLVEPFPGKGNADVTKALVKAGYDEIKMVKTAERFFTSIGLDPLPKTFWERSLFKKPQDREVVCHASAWDVHYNDDLRIKMCIQITGEELNVVHHELGHDYYFHYYFKEPVLFQQGANDGFHEAIGDAIALSITPGYLEKIGLGKKGAGGEEADVNYLMKMALDKVAFLPFGKLIDQWRWDVFAGKIPPASFNKGWWDLRTKYQGIAPPVPRSEADFDPGAKYH